MTADNEEHSHEHRLHAATRRIRDLEEAVAFFQHASDRLRERLLEIEKADLDLERRVRRIEREVESMRRAPTPDRDTPSGDK